MPFYGMELFSCRYIAATGARKATGNTRILLGVSSRGLHFFKVKPDPVNGGELVEETQFWPYSQLFSWGRSPHQFAFTTNENDGTRYCLETTDGDIIAAIIHGYV